MIANHPHIWGDWLSCDPLRGSHDSQSPHILYGHNYSYHIRGDRSPLSNVDRQVYFVLVHLSKHETMNQC